MFIDEVDNVIGLVSDWLELDSYDEFVRHDSEVVRTIPLATPLLLERCFSLGLMLSPSQALTQELAYASYLGMHTLVLPPPRNRAHVADYARAVNSCLSATGTSQHLNLSIRIPIYVPPAATLPFLSQSNLQASENELIATWEMWDTIRTICGYHPRLSLSKSSPRPMLLG